MVISNGLLTASVAHTRYAPRRNAFRYHVYYLCFALDELAQLGKLSLLSHNRPNLFGFYDRDHGPCTGEALEPWIRRLLAEWDIPQADGRIVLLTLPRLFGYVFNPVSFWFCFDRQGGLRAVLSEVGNTFGDRHCYISFHDDRRPITADDWMRADKVFHVSPFIEIKGYYLFRFTCRDDKVGVWINHYDGDGRDEDGHNDNDMLLSTSLTGKRSPLTSANLLRCFFRYPLVTLKVIGLIHYQALKLWLKGIRYRTRQPLPPTEVSR